MRAIKAALLSAAVLLLATLLLAGCVTSTADGIQLQPLAAGGGDPAAALNIDPATYVIVEFERTGGIAGIAERARLYLDGHVLLERQDTEPVTFQLSQAEQAHLTAALDAADFYRNAAQSEPPDQPVADAFQYRILRRGVLLGGEVLTQDGSAPEWLQPLLPLLSNLLLAPDPDRLQPWEPTPAAVASDLSITTTLTAPTAPADAAAPTLVLLEFVRSQPGREVRVLVNLDRSYSVAHAGRIVEGELTRDEMSALLRLLETADLKERAGDYTPDDPCPDCVRYEVSYRNLLGGSTVTGRGDALPEWMQVLVVTLEDAFAGAEPAASASPTALAAGATPTTTLAAPAATVSSTPAATATAPSTPAPSATTATPTPAQEVAYSALDLLVDLAGQGAQVEAQAGRVAKPYLSVPGSVLRVNGQPVQLFQYTDAAALAADVAGLAPNASSIGGAPLVWQAAPHFWRQGGLLVLAVSDDAALVDLLSSVLGPPFAGR